MVTGDRRAPPPGCEVWPSPCQAGVAGSRGRGVSDDPELCGTYWFTRGEEKSPECLEGGQRRGGEQGGKETGGEDAKQVHPSCLQGDRFSKHTHLGNRKLLWHGTNVAVVAAILKTGLRIMPHSGGRVGSGIYFASEQSKSAAYGKEWHVCGACMR